MKINEIMSKNFESVAPNTSVKEAGILMHDKHIGFVPVIDNGQPVGILTDRDICICGVAVGRDAVMTKVKEIMIKGVATCYEDDDIEDDDMSDEDLEEGDDDDLTDDELDDDDDDDLTDDELDEEDDDDED